MLKESGNLLEEGIPITKELLTFCKQNGYRISLKNGDYHQDEIHLNRSKNNNYLVSRVYHLCMNGELYPADFFEVFGFRKATQVTTMVKGFAEANGLPYTKPNRIYRNEALRKFEDTNFKRFGFINASKSEEIKERVRVTSLSKFGVTNASKSEEILGKISKTNLQRYGVERPLQSPEIQESMRASNLSKYGVDHVAKIPEVRKKMRDTIFERYQVDHNWASPELRARGDQRFAKTLEIFKDLGEGVLDETEAVNHFNTYQPTQRLSLLKKVGIKTDTNFSTELKVKAFLESLGINFIQNAKKAHGVKRSPEARNYYDADFLILDRKLVIEINGLAFHSANRSAYDNRKPKDYHLNKFKAFHDAGYRMISFTDYELDNMWSSVTEIIKFHLGLVTELSESTKVEYQEFLGYPIEESLNYNFFNKESIDFEKEVEINPKMIGKWEYYDCGRIKRTYA